MPDSTSDTPPGPGISAELWNSPRVIATGEARVAKQSAGVALARWQVHRRDCTTCQVVTPPAGPAQCCWKGGKLLTEYLKRRDKAVAASAAIPRAGRFVQGTLG